MSQNFPKFFSLILIILSSWISSIGQEPFYWQLTEEDGLPSMTIYQVHQDKKGFMWFGTENGICRYDGKEMETYYHPDLLDNEILTIQEDSWGRIWFKNLAGQLAYVEDGRIKEIELSDSLILAEFGIVDDYLIGLFSVYRNGYVKKYHIEKDGMLKKQYVKEGIEANIQNIQRNGSKIYFTGGSFLKKGKGANYNVIEFNCNEDKLTEFVLPYKGRIIKNLNIISNDRLIADMETKISFLRIQKDSIVVTEEKDYSINVHDVFEWNEHLYAASENGIISLFDNREPILNEFKFNQSLVDREGNIWLGTNENGLLIINSLNTFYNKNNSKLNSNSIYCLHPFQEDKLLVGQDGGVMSVIQNREVSHTQLNFGGRIRIIQSQSNEFFWLGGDNFPLTILSNDLTKVRSVKSIKGIKELAIQNDEFIWTAASGRGIRFPINIFLDTPNTKEIEYLGHDRFYIGGDSIDMTGLLNIPFRVYAIYNASDFLWVGASKGIYKFRHKNLIPFLENDKHIPYSVSAITQSKDSTIWVSTQANGILGIKNDSIIHRLDEKSGLATNNCSNLFYDEYNNLWIGSKKGLHKLNLNTYELDIINKYDGMPTNEISAVYARDSILWIGTQKGLMEIPYSAIQKNITPPPIHITNIAFWEKDTTLLSSYDLKYNQNNVNIEFVGTTYRNRGNTDYQYRMLGVDTNWVNTSTRFARYPFLNPGEYEFQVKAINEDRVESFSAASIQFNISQPWWQTWWFYSISIIGGISMMGFLFYLRIERLKQQQEIDQKFKDLRMMALQAQMNPHFVFNALSAIQKFLTTNEQEKAMIYLARFAQLIRNIFEQSKEKLITLDEEFEFLKLYLEIEKLRFKDKVEINFGIDKTILRDDYDIQIPPLIIQPIIENAFKHGLMHKEEGGKLRIEFSKEKEFLICEIEDNGVGRKMAKEMGEERLKYGQSSGLKTAKERLNIFNKTSVENIDYDSLTIKDLIDENQNPIGTRIKIKIKYTG